MGALDHAVTLSGRLVRLRPISRDDYPALFGWRSSLETVHMLNFRRRVGTYEEFVRELEGVLAGGMLLLVEEGKGGRPVGYVLAHNINPWEGWLMVGMYVEPQYRYRGHGGEAALLCVDALFRWFPLREIMTEIYEFAEPLLRMARAMGFEEAGYLPGHYWHEDRNWGSALHGVVPGALGGDAGAVRWRSGGAAAVRRADGDERRRWPGGAAMRGEGLLVRVRELVAEVAGLDAEEVEEDDVLWEEEGGLALDSLDALRLALLLAEEYGLEEPGEVEMEGIRTVRDVAERLAQLIPNGGGP